MSSGPKECRNLSLTSKDPFKVTARELGSMRPGLSLDNIGELLEAVDGSNVR